MDSFNNEELKKHLKVLKELGFEEIILDKKFISKDEILKERKKLLEKINEEIQICEKCDLHKSRTNAVLGEGNIETRLMFVGEAPGEEEDKQGRPFVGRAGKLLTKLIERAGYKREEFYIANICKCRPPGNRTPTLDEMEKCFPYLKEQIEIINPKVLCLLGAVAGQAFLNRKVKITKERGTVIKWNDRILLLTYHPAYVLRNPKEEETLFKDIKRAIEIAYKGL
ncbi:MAG: uracil-DNA glycosylase [Persephonella sp.]|nr:MAG: uracil-DNA glycosylase [Persephonella sp.]